jgi:hypothetical protein
MTSIEWLDEQIQEYVISVDHVANTMLIQISFEDYMNFKRQAKEMHKAEIIDAFWNGDNSDCTNEQNSKEFAEQYYKETFKQLS